MTRGTIRPGGRTERVRQKIAATVLQFIKDDKTEFTILDVTQVSGIARSTIYARWPTREALIAEALNAHNSTFQVEAKDDWRKHLHAIALAFRDFSVRPDEIAINGLTAKLARGLLSEETLRQWQSISHEMSAPLRVAQAKGEIRQDVDTSMLIATLFTTIAGLIGLAKETPTDDYLAGLVRLLVAGSETTVSKTG